MRIKDQALGKITPFVELKILPYGRKIYRFIYGEAPVDTTIFDPEKGETVVTPEKDQEGNWAGAPSALYADGKIYLYYRLRNRTERGYKSVIAESEDGENFSTLATINAEELYAMSIEGAAFIREKDVYRLYISYQESGSGRWKIGLIEAEHPSELEAGKCRKISFPVSCSRYHYKDPVLSVGEMFVNTFSRFYLESQTLGLGKESNLEYSYGKQVSNKFRLTGVIPLGERFLVFYDHGKSPLFTWEERAGAAVTHDFEEFKSVLEGPIKSEKGTGSLRYIEPVEVGEEIWFYYEVSTEKRGHELRVNKVDKEKVRQAVEEKI